MESHYGQVFLSSHFERRGKFCEQLCKTAPFSSFQLNGCRKLMINWKKPLCTALYTATQERSVVISIKFVLIVSVHYNTHTVQVMRIQEMITAVELKKYRLTFKQVLPTNNQQNVGRLVRGICTMMLGLKGLSKNS